MTLEKSELNVHDASRPDTAERVGLSARRLL
jgi:hypothetical protein